MENGESYEIVHSKTMDIAFNLNELAKISSTDKAKIIDKARLFLNYSKKIREDKSYSSFYTALTNKILNNKKINTNKNVETIEQQKETLEYVYDWDNIPAISFDDVAGLDDVKEDVKNKILLPLIKPELFEGYSKNNGGGLLLYGPPGTGKTMIAAAIAHEIKAKFCALGPSDILNAGIGKSEKAIAQLFKEARTFDCAIIFFDEMESICPASTHAQHARQIRSEMLRQMQGLDSYCNENNKILYLIASTNKPWDVDPAFLRPGRFGTHILVDLPNDDARRYMIQKKLEKIKLKGLVKVEEIDIAKIIDLTKGFNGADITYLLDKMQELSIARSITDGNKVLKQEDFDNALNFVKTSVQINEINKIKEWSKNNG